ncbi:NUDIX hydrolase [Corynebacterium pseudodiphtheriticum]|uniref:NUDIX hydrolase n=1 Tax=Corynebacterium pseudodiphtheriticum TaxID=37637 RepID=UPI000F880B57|nr:CoA pyrophosphatase [Corynebacterium pseudodiphtheriticum]RUP92497.1 CoA pyrophosphatase [Corynebacterium pseudodiphtheriticum]WKS29932.1 CoA pyrophosphatase [Corynebacterium pseudodiphtheriticum]WKS51357.1 CoA pyrophosphatase [Corynebacterium pseudodiphtheriticum]
MIANSDHPGCNIAVQPEQAPQWLGKLAGLHEDSLQKYLPNRSAEEFNLPKPKTIKKAAVLMLFGGSQAPAGDGGAPDDATVLLIHRHPGMRSHSGQIAFPGGRIDNTDLSPVDTALREAWEETGLNRNNVTPLKQFNELAIPVTGNQVHPVLSYWDKPSEVAVTSPEEADDVFTVHVGELLTPENRFVIGHGNWVSPAFRVRDYVIWGFTAGLLNAVFHYSGWERDWNKTDVFDLRESLAKSRNNEALR